MFDFLRGPKGPKGDKGDKGDSVVNGEIVTCPPGPKGDKGDKGDSSVINLQPLEDKLDSILSSDYQIRNQISDLYQKVQNGSDGTIDIDSIVNQVIAKLPAQNLTDSELNLIIQKVTANISSSTTNIPPTTVSSAPAPIGAYGVPMDAMTASEIAAFVPELQRGVGTRLAEWQPLVDRIKSELLAGIYSVDDEDICVHVGDWYWNGGNKTLILPYLAAVDQRNPVTNKRWPIGDPNIVKVSGVSTGSTVSTSTVVSGVSDALPPAFQWPRDGNVPPVGSGGPSGALSDARVHRDGFICVGNIAPEGTNATSGPNGQGMGINGNSKGKIRVNTRGGADSDGGMRDMTNYVQLAEREGAGTISRRGYDIYCSVPDAVSIQTAVWTINPDGKRDGGIFLLKRVDATHFIGNWSDPALDYENRSFVISGADQPDKDRFSTKSGADSNAGYGWRVDKPRNSTENHADYANGGFSDKGDFLVRFFHDNGSQDIGRYSRYKLFNEGRGLAFATSNGTYSDCRDVLVMQPGANGQPGHVDIAIEGYGLRTLETFDLPDGRRGLCFSPERVPTVQD